MTKLPESKNPNLRPLAAPPAVRPIPKPPPMEPPRGPSRLRSIAAMVVIGGGFAVGIYYYIKGSEVSVVAEESINKQLYGIGLEYWNASNSLEVEPLDEEATKDLDDLPRIIAAVKDRASRENLEMELLVVTGDPPPGKYTATHQLRYTFNSVAHLIIRLRVEKESLYFLGEANRVVPSRVNWEQGITTVSAEDALPPVINHKKTLTKPFAPSANINSKKPFNLDTPPPAVAPPPAIPPATTGNTTTPPPPAPSTAEPLPEPAPPAQAPR